uniref:Uncharacterized protein n=1 Tax=Tanacetum cinerariifolium TaxID=118510 RepID=A0A6L2N3B0_TANCI|nr:hypothetical protein [Tanacetum cinerariifolium]
MQALVDKKKVIITEDNIRSDLRFDDAEGTACLPNEAIFKGLTHMGATTAWNEFSSTMASAIICLADNQKFNFSKMIKEIDQDYEIALDVDTQERKTDDEMFEVDDLTREEVVTTIANKVSAAPTINVTEDKIIMAQALAALKSVKPTIPAAATNVTTVVPTPRAKGIIRMDKEYARLLEAEEQEAARLSRAQQDEEANISWDNIQAMMDADSLLAERLQAREMEEFSEVQKARLLVELIKKRKKHFSTLRAQEKRNKPPTKAQMRGQMCIYLRNIGGYKHSHLKGMSYHEIKKLFDREMRKVNAFIAMDSEAQKSNRKEAQESSTKRTVESLESDISKRQKVDENVEPVIDDTEDLKRCMEIVPDDGDEVLIEVTPISSRSPTIIDYKIHKEGKKNYFKIIRGDGNSQVYQTFKKMFKNFNREDVEVLWAIVKDRFKKENQWRTWIIFCLKP